ncbi:uncharacterized protein LOC129594221 [Paramacrobiotus metropolitanus]|uniref:uncharacterized protein LOC129594221 n=1 Tax=Paramacrobiotus metropolitanus TaxID=2943436 RepID=UPI0024459314|nr:uncharacterized protein LOC129594221 [Paramacrobiotus metropolitanus]
MAAHRLTGCEKAYFKLKQQLTNLRPGYAFSTAESIFEATLGGISCFGAELIGPDPSIDKFRLKFWKSHFELKTNAPHDALYYLTGSYPLHFRAIKMQLQFIKKLLRYPNDSLLKAALVDSVMNGVKRKKVWLRRALKHLAVVKNFSWKSSDILFDELKNLNVTKTMSLIEVKFQETLAERLRANTARSGRLFFLFQVYPKRPLTATRLPLPPYLLKALFTLLTSGHHFRIETGRWNGTAHDERLCPYCDVVDTEEHSFFVCPAFEPRRQLIWSKIENLRPEWATLKSSFFNVLRQGVFFTDTDKELLFWITKFIYFVLKDARDVHNGTLCLLPYLY